MREASLEAIVGGALEIEFVGDEELKESAKQYDFFEQLQVEWMIGIEDGVESHGTGGHWDEKETQVGHEVVFDHEFHTHEHRAELMADGQEDEECAIVEIEHEYAQNRLGEEDTIDAENVEVVPRAENAREKEHDKERDHSGDLEHECGHGQLWAGQVVLVGDASVLDDDRGCPQPEYRIQQ